MKKTKFILISILFVMLISCSDNSSKCIDLTQDLDRVENDLKEKATINNELNTENYRLKERIFKLEDQCKDLNNEIDKCERNKQKETIIYNNNELKGIITSPSDGHANLRETPEADGFVIGKIEESTNVNVIGKVGRWFKIRTSDGYVGYIHNSLILIIN
jgi:hypothetical protein